MSKPLLPTAKLVSVSADGLLTLVERPGAGSVWVFDLSTDDSHIAGAPLALRYSEECGRFCVATRAIRAGEVILSERPLLRAGSDRGSEDWGKAGLVAFTSAPAETRAAVLAFHSVAPDHPSPMAESVRDQVARYKGAPWRRGFDDDTLARTLLIFQLNSYPVDKRSCLFPVGSKINHSCDANAVYEGRDGCGCFTANRPIALGEPVTSNYIGSDTIMSTPARRRLLLATRLFLCHAIAVHERQTPLGCCRARGATRGPRRRGCSRRLSRTRRAMTTRFTTCAWAPPELLPRTAASRPCGTATTAPPRVQCRQYSRGKEGAKSR